jgi:hypothetical protein
MLMHHSFILVTEYLHCKFSSSSDFVFGTVLGPYFVAYNLQFWGLYKFNFLPFCCIASLITLCLFLVLLMKLCNMLIAVLVITTVVFSSQLSSYNMFQLCIAILSLHF